MGMLIFFFLLSIGFSFLCSLWEASLLTIPPSYVEARAQEGSSVGKILKRFKKDVDEPLAAILTLNTIAHTVGAIGVGAQATKIWPGNELMTGAVVPVVMTLAILILSEIIPKTLGATYWRKFSGFTARTLNFTIKAIYPLVWLSQQITKLLKGKGHQTTMSRGDMAALATLSEREGVIEARESTMMQNLLSASETPVRDVMTPRTVMLTAEADTTVAAFLQANPELPFSRIPLTNGGIDQIESYVLKDTLLLAGYRGEGQRMLRDFARPLLSVEVDQPIPRVFDALVRRREHIALVLGEFGGTAGLVTQEDIIETLLGFEIVDETDRAEDMQHLAEAFRERRRERAERNGTRAKTTVDVAEESVAERQAQIHERSGGATIGLTGETPAADAPS